MPAAGGSATRSTREQRVHAAQTAQDRGVAETVRRAQHRRKATLYRSALSMLIFYFKGAGKS